jgi:hypothetical protein
MRDPSRPDRICGPQCDDFQESCLLSVGIARTVQGAALFAQPSRLRATPLQESREHRGRRLAVRRCEVRNTKDIDFFFKQQFSIFFLQGEREHRMVTDLDAQFVLLLRMIVENSDCIRHLFDRFLIALTKVFLTLILSLFSKVLVWDPGAKRSLPGGRANAFRPGMRDRSCLFICMAPCFKKALRGLNSRQTQKHQD